MPQKCRLGIRSVADVSGCGITGLSQGDDTKCPRADCFEHAEYLGYTAKSVDNILTPEDCQEECKVSVACTHFTWRSGNCTRSPYTCLLKGKKVILATSRPNTAVLSGPKQCDVADDCVDDDRPFNLTVKGDTFKFKGMNLQHFFCDSRNDVHTITETYCQQDNDNGKMVRTRCPALCGDCSGRMRVIMWPKCTDTPAAQMLWESGAKLGSLV